jgi:hypothetical protein
MYQLLIVVLALFIMNCGVEKVRENRQINECQQLTKLIKNTVTPNVFGIDRNKNGIRDDVEIWIAMNYDEYVACIKKQAYTSQFTDEYMLLI